MLKSNTRKSVTELKLDEIERLLDRNVHRRGDKSSAREPSDPKDLYEVCVDLAIYVLVKLSEDDTSTDHSSEFTSHLVGLFAKHLRWHAAQDSRHKAKPARRSKKGKLEVDRLTCLPSALTFFKLLQLSKGIRVMAKQKELANKLFGLLPPLFTLENAINPSSTEDQSLNLNQMMVMQAGSQAQQQVLPEIATGGGAAETLGSVQSTLRAAQNSNQTPSRKRPAEVEERGRFRTKSGAASKVSNFRANSEPPDALTNYHLHSTEELKVSEINKTFKNDDSSKLKLNLNQAAIASANRGRNVTKVPPILVNKVQHHQQSQHTAGHNNFQSTSSSIVMNNFFNMPHGQLHQTHTATGGHLSAQKSSQYKYHAQNQLAKSRLTRRQQSITKNTAQTLSSNNLLKQLSAH